MSKNRTSLKKICMLSVAIVCAFASIVSASSIMGMSEFQECVRTDIDIVCYPKMSFTVPVSYGLEKNIEITTPTGPVQLLLEKPSMPALHYPLKYLHTVAYYPYEQVARQEATVSDIMRETNISKLDKLLIDSVLVEGSDGFTIVKTKDDLIKSNYSLLWWRGEELLGERSTFPDNIFYTAHRMNPGLVFFNGYEILRHTKGQDTYASGNSNITRIKLTEGSEQHTITIYPDNPIYSSVHDTEYGGSFKLDAGIIGDMDAYTGDPDFSNYILYVPAYPASHPMVIDYQNNMLLVPREEMSKDGSELNKVGVNFDEFNTQANAGKTSKEGDGLSNQLFHKLTSDLAKLIANPNDEATYLINFKRILKRSMSFEAGLQKALVYKIPEINYSLINLSIDKPLEISEIKNESNGIIVSSAVMKFPCLSETGVCTVIIENIGSFKANYIVTITQGTMNLINAPAQARTLNPDEEAELEFDIYTNFNLDTSNEFLVTLKSDTGKIYDQVWTKFDTEKHDVDYSWEHTEKNTASEDITPTP